MASGERDKLLKENKEGSNDSVPNYGSSAEYQTASGCSANHLTASSISDAKDENDIRGFSKSSPAVLEHSKELPRRSVGKSIHMLRKLFSRSWPPSSTQVAIGSSEDSSSYEHEQQRSGEHQSGNEQEASMSSSGDSHGHEDEPLINQENRTNQQQTDKPRTSCCANFRNCYYKCVGKIENSCFIHIVQFFAFLDCVSIIVMGIIHFKSCEGKYASTNPFLSIVMAVFGLFLIYMWVVKVCRQHRGERFWNHDKNRLIMFLLVVLFFMALEFLFFVQITPKALQAQKVTCTSPYYDYLYYMHIVNGGFLAFAALLYLPDFFIYICKCRRLVPSQQNGHVEPV